jgi:hypothetical protein
LTRSIGHLYRLINSYTAGNTKRSKAVKRSLHP